MLSTPNGTLHISIENSSQNVKNQDTRNVSLQQKRNNNYKWQMAAQETCYHHQRTDSAAPKMATKLKSHVQVNERAKFTQIHSNNMHMYAYVFVCMCASIYASACNPWAAHWTTPAVGDISYRVAYLRALAHWARWGGSAERLAASS